MTTPTVGHTTSGLLVDRTWFERLVSWAIVDGYRVIAPTERSGTTHYDEIASAREMAMPTPVPLLPLREVFPAGPASRYGSPGASDHGGPEVSVCRPARTLVVGSRPCDAAALAVMEEFFSAHSGPTRFARLGDALVVSVACSRPDAYCFCTSVGGGPASGVGSDVVVRHRRGGGLWLEAQTEDGAALLRAVGGEGGDSSAQPQAEPVPVLEAKFDAERVGAWLRARAGDESWEFGASHCRGCGVCRFLCPTTCHCLELGDAEEWRCGVASGAHACCAASLFAHDDGARRPPWARWREWLLHKFVLFPERFGRPACVGCGRCQRACGMGESLVRVLQEVELAARAAESAWQERPSPACPQ